MIFTKKMQLVATGQQEFSQYFPEAGWVEHDAEEIWQSVLAAIHFAIRTAGITARNIAALGITNQRETTLLWERDSGRPIHRAIVWQDRRSEAMCTALRRNGFGDIVTQKTGLLVDPYFSATKIAWLLDHVDGARAAAEAGKLAFGTIDSYLIWKLTGGKRHVTDATNASRTMLFNIHSQQWDDEILTHLRLPRALLPEVLDCADDFGHVDPALLGSAIAITGVAGDQQAATIGQACFTPGMMKATYGTGCFAMLNTGDKAVVSKNRLLTTLCYRLKGKPVYALEGSIFMAGAGVQWLRDGLKIIDKASMAGERAAQADADQPVYVVPAFVGLGAPYWDARARGAIFGLSRGTGQNEIIRATLEAVGYQTHDLIEAMKSDMGGLLEAVLRVDGGMAASDWTMQFLADILDAPIDRPQILETTALGAAWLAGSHIGVWPNQDEFSAHWQCERRFEPRMTGQKRAEKLSGWHEAVRRTLSEPDLMS